MKIGFGAAESSSMRVPPVAPMTTGGKPVPPEIIPAFTATTAFSSPSFFSASWYLGGSNSLVDTSIKVSILFGMQEKRKQIFLLGDRPYELVEVSGPICRGKRCFPSQFDHESRLLKISKSVPQEQRAWVAAVAVSDACFRLWRPIPVIWPDWVDDRPRGLPPPR